MRQLAFRRLFGAFGRAWSRPSCLVAGLCKDAGGQAQGGLHASGGKAAWLLALHSRST